MYIINTADLLIERRSCVLQLQLIEQFSSNGLGKMIKELVQGSTNLMIHGNVYVSLLTRGMSMGINSSQMMIKVSQKNIDFSTRTRMHQNISFDIRVYYNAANTEIRWKSIDHCKTRWILFAAIRCSSQLFSGY